MDGEPAQSESASPGNKEKLSESQRKIQNFWPNVMREMQQLPHVEPGNQLLPLARIKKIMKLDEDVKMISSDAPLLFAKAIEIFIHELTLRAWLHTEHNKRRTLQRSDIAMAITKYDQFDFLIDIVPREEIKLTKRSYEVRVSPSGIENVQYYLQLAQQNQQVLNQQQEQQPEQEQEQHQEANQEQPQQQVITTGGVTATPVKAVAMTVMGLSSATTTAAATKTVTTATASAAAITANTANTIVHLKQTNLQQTLQSTSSQQPRQQKPSQGLQAISFLNSSAVAGNSGSSSTSTTGSTATIPTINQPLQLVQHFITPTGEITQIPITIPPNQLNFIRTAVPMAGATGATAGTASVQPIFLPAAAALQATPTFIHTPPGCMYFSASQLQQFQQQQQQQQQHHQQQQQRD